MCEKNESNEIKLFEFHFTTELYALYMYLYFSYLNFIAVSCIHSVFKSLNYNIDFKRTFIMFYFHIGLFKYFNKGAIRVITYSSLKIKFFRMLLYCIFFFFVSSFKDAWPCHFLGRQKMAETDHVLDF